MFSCFGTCTRTTIFYVLTSTRTVGVQTLESRGKTNRYFKVSQLEGFDLLTLRLQGESLTNYIKQAWLSVHTCALICYMYTHFIEVFVYVL